MTKINIGNGFIKIYRKIWENPLSKKPNYLSILIYLVSNANYKDKEIIWNNENVLIKRGQFIGSIKKIGEHFNLSPATVSYVLNYLQKEKMIVRKSNKRFTLFEICNYDFYQKLETKVETIETAETTINNGLEGTQNKKLKPKLKSNRNQIETTKKEKKDKNLYIPELQKEIINKYPHVAKMEMQLSKEDCKKLTSQFTDVEIHEILSSMENYKPLLKNNRSVYLTFMNWHKRKYKSNGTNGSSKNIANDTLDISNG